MREQLMLLVPAFAQEDPDFLAEAVLPLSGGRAAGEGHGAFGRRCGPDSVPGALAEGDPAGAAAQEVAGDRGRANIGSRRR